MCAIVGKLPPGTTSDFDLRPVDPGERVARVLGSQLADRIGVGGAEALQRQHLQPVFGFVVVLRTADHLVGVRRHQRDPPRSQRAHRLADRHGRGQRRHARALLHAPDRHLVVVVGEQAGGGLRQRHHFYLGGAQQLRLVGDIRIEAGRNGGVAALAQAADMDLQVRGQQPGILDLARRVGGRDQHAEMSHHGVSRSVVCFPWRCKQRPVDRAASRVMVREGAPSTTCLATHSVVAMAALRPP